MLDDLRQQTSELFDQEELPAPPAPPPPTRIFGMTPFQAFILALMLLIITVLLSAFCLLVSGRVVPPFLQ